MKLTYRESLYNSYELKEIIPEYVKLLPSHVTHLICASSSGCAVATGIALLAKHVIEVTYVKQKGWSFHHIGADKTDGFEPYDYDKISISGVVVKPNEHLCFVDDIIDYGETFKACAAYAKDNGAIVDTVLVYHMYGTRADLDNVNVLRCDGIK